MGILSGLKQFGLGELENASLYEKPDPKEIKKDTDASVVKEGRAKKVIVYKYKRKTGYHKKNGHRQAFTQVKIEKING